MNKQDYYIKRRRGIYRIAHKLNGMCYIGQSVDIVSRWRQHTTPNKSCIGQAITAEPDLFTFEILEECSKELLNERECHYIQLYNCIHPLGYNKTSGGSSSKEMSEDTKKKIGEAVKNMSDETRQKMSEARKGKTHSEETKKKMSEARKNRPPHSEETKKRISEGGKGSKTMSDEAKQKISEAQQRRHALRKAKLRMS